MKKLREYPWPGNVRELQSAIERAVILASGFTLYPDDFMLKTTANRRLKNVNLNLDELEREAIEKALQQSGGNMSQAAELLGISRFSLYRKIEKQGNR